MQGDQLKYLLIKVFSIAYTLFRKVLNFYTDNLITFRMQYFL